MTRTDRTISRTAYIVFVVVCAVLGGTYCQRESSHGSQTEAKSPAVSAEGADIGVASVEQIGQGAKPPATPAASSDGLGVGFHGPQGTFGPHGRFRGRNPSDNSLAVGPNHIVQTVNTQMAIYTKKGKLFDTTGKVLYGPVDFNNVFKGFGGACEAHNDGDAVVRYDQLADRWLLLIIGGHRDTPPSAPFGDWRDGHAHLSPPGRPGQPGAAAPLFQPPQLPDSTPPPPKGTGSRPDLEGAPYAMCYAISATPDPLGAYYRYEFDRPYFPDYPRPAVWPDGYYLPTSSSDERVAPGVVTQRHACVLDRAKMLQGRPATEQCFIVENVNFLNNADVDGMAPPPAGAPNIVMADGGTELDSILDDDGIYIWQVHVDWRDPSKSSLTGPQKIAVARYHFLCGGQMKPCVPQSGTDQRLESQGDKLMQRLAYRNVNGHESILVVHSISTVAGGGGVRWYEFRVSPNRSISLFQQGTYAPDSGYRWLPSGAMDKHGNIGIGYSFSSASQFPGQRFAARLADDPPGQLTLHEAVLADGENAQVDDGGWFQAGHVIRWEDFTQTAIDPSDDCTIWYVGDYLQKGAHSYSTKIGAFRLPGC